MIIIFWDAISSIDPIIVICEYNAIFGTIYSCTVPYDDNFVRTQKHYSNLYFGASIKALCKLAKSKGYEFVGANTNYVNAFFVKTEYANKYMPNLITKVDKSMGESKFKESRDKNGDLTFLKGIDRIDLIESMPVINIDNNEKISIRELLKK